jgi:hypothetical protein
MPKRKSLADLETGGLKSAVTQSPKAPKDRTHISIHMPVSLWQSVKMLAIHKGCRANDLWIVAMDEYLKREGLPGMKS